MFKCRNQSCEAQWEQSDVVIKNEGQGLLFRCPMCGARNYVERFDADDGAVADEQIEGRPVPWPHGRIVLSLQPIASHPYE